MWLLLLQVLLAFPVTHAYATQVKKDVVVSITYTDLTPSQVCVGKHDLSDVEMSFPRESHCWTPKSPIGDLDVWKDMRLDEANFEVVVQYPNGTSTIIYLTQIINS